MERPVGRVSESVDFVVFVRMMSKPGTPADLTSSSTTTYAMDTKQQYFPHIVQGHMHALAPYTADLHIHIYMNVPLGAHLCAHTLHRSVLILAQW